MPLNTTWSTLTAQADVSVATSTVTTLHSATSFVQDKFGGISGAKLLTHVGEIGATWTRHPATPAADIQLSGSSTAYPIVNSWFVPSGTPPSADYAVRGTLIQKSVSPQFAVDLLARSSATANTRYGARYATTDNRWEIYKVVDGVTSALTGRTESLTTDQQYAMEFRIEGSRMTLTVDGALKLAASDASLTLAGYATFTEAVATVAATDSTGLHITNFGAESLASISTSTVTTQTVTAVPSWAAQSAASSAWAPHSAASTAWSTL